MLELDSYRVKPGAAVDLASVPTNVDGGFDEDDAKRQFKKLRKQLSDMQEMMYAQGKHTLLVIFQAMDCAGKDSTIRSVFGPLNPQGVHVSTFKAPTRNELDRDYLWRVHAQVPPRGYFGIFNRSHYEDVLIVRVKDLVPEQRWKQRYDHINAFEKLLHDEGTSILKFFLHISKDYQKSRLQRRLDRPDKHWKFNPDDLVERKRWDDYQRAYADALSRCSTEHAPWYIIPAETRWFRNLLVASIVRAALDRLELRFPQPNFDPRLIVIE